MRVPSPISKAAAILVIGFSAASFSFLASKRGLYSKIGSRLTNDGTTRRASHIFNALGLSPGSGNLGSSGSTTMCFFSRVHPLSFPFRPFGFWIGFCSMEDADVPSGSNFFLVTEDAIDVVDFMKDSAAGVSFDVLITSFRISMSLSPVFSGDDEQTDAVTGSCGSVNPLVGMCGSVDTFSGNCSWMFVLA
uniref:Uncharacterized protein n=1 Tax=Fundulus heteroclitus TaxID=8078 RepID=A0A3Q2QJ27_FUNHE